MPTQRDNTRRDFLRISAIVGTALILSGGKSKDTSPADERAEKPSLPQKKGKKDEEVTATEDLMREHGILRRALLVYTETAIKLRSNPASVLPDALQKTAKLFRTFGEDYHEKKLEEAYIFPAVKHAGGPVAAYPDILLAQHQRGREITSYILAVTQDAKLDATSVTSLAQTLVPCLASSLAV